MSDAERNATFAAAQNMAALIQHIANLQTVLAGQPAPRVAHEAAPASLVANAQSWATLKTLIFVATVLTSLVVGTLSIGRYWQVADSNFALLKQMNRAVRWIVPQLQHLDSRLRVLEHQKGIDVPPWPPPPEEP